MQDVNDDANKKLETLRSPKTAKIKNVIHILSDNHSKALPVSMQQPLTRIEHLYNYTSLTHVCHPKELVHIVLS